MQKVATRIFMCASIAFGVLGITAVVTQAEDGGVLMRFLLVTVFILLPSFALSVAGKYLNGK